MEISQTVLLLALAIAFVAGLMIGLGSIWSRRDRLTRDETQALNVLYFIGNDENWNGYTETVNRLIAQRDNYKRKLDVANYDSTVVENARKMRVEVMQVLAAAILSQPDKKLRITRRGMHAMSLQDELGHFEDLPTGDQIWYVKPYQGPVTKNPVNGVVTNGS